jgi:hypothetical protein
VPLQLSDMMRQVQKRFLIGSFEVSPVGELSDQRQ